MNTSNKNSPPSDTRGLPKPDSHLELNIPQLSNPRKHRGQRSVVQTLLEEEEFSSVVDWLCELPDSPAAAAC